MGSRTRASHSWQGPPSVMAASTCARAWPLGTHGLCSASTAQQLSVVGCVAYDVHMGLEAAATAACRGGGWCSSYA